MERWATRRELADVAREVGKLRGLLESHDREHEKAERVREQTARERDRQRRALRRYWVTTLLTALVTNAATILAVHVHLEQCALVGNTIRPPLVGHGLRDTGEGP